MEQLSLLDLMQATRGQLSAVSSFDQQIDQISIDSRTLQPGSVFWALRGEQHDGHDFLPQAASRGAALSVVDAAHAEAAVGPTLIVKDTGKCNYEAKG